VFVEAIGWVPCVSEEQHRPDPLTQKPIRNLTYEQSAKALPMKAPQDIDLVEFALVARHATIVAPAPCETNELMGGLFHNKREVRYVVRAENPVPLSLTRGHARSTTVRFTECLNVQCGQRRNVANGRFAQVKGHWLTV
jgi:hypothetical protein